MEQKVDQLEEKLKRVEESVEVLKEKNNNTTLEKELRENKNDVNDLEQYVSRRNLRIFGIEEKGNEENCKAHIVDLCKTKLKINITENGIDAAHKVGGRHENRPRGNIVRFYRRTIRNRSNPCPQRSQRIPRNSTRGSHASERRTNQPCYQSSAGRPIAVLA